VASANLHLIKRGRKGEQLVFILLLQRKGVLQERII
jgi:hypothetical protein